LCVICVSPNFFAWAGKFSFLSLFLGVSVHFARQRPKTQRARSLTLFLPCAVPVAPKHFSFVMSTNGTTSALDHKRSTLATCTENCDQRWPGGSHCMDCSGVPPYVLDLGVCVVSQQSSWSCCTYAFNESSI
jgi:hypothetical protein